MIGRITSVRRQLSAALGFVVPRVRIRDDLALSPNSYRISVGGVVVGEDSVYPDRMLALVTEMVMQPIDGLAVRDPSFGMDALWIEPWQNDAALAAGYTVVDAATVIGTHLNHLLQQQAHAILGQDEVQALLDVLSTTSPALAANLVPKAVSLPVLTRVLQLLLMEAIPIRDFRRIAEAIAMHGEAIPDPVVLAERIRPALGGIIIQRVAGLGVSLRVVVFDPALEDLLVRAVRTTGAGDAPFEPPLVERILASYRTILTSEAENGTGFAVVTVPSVRRQVARLLATQFDDVTVIGFNELPERKPVEVIAAIGGTAEGG